MRVSIKTSFIKDSLSGYKNNKTNEKPANYVYTQY